MGVIERLPVYWQSASLFVLAALAGLSASLVSCPQVSVKSVPKAGMGITAEIPLLGPILGSTENHHYREFQEDDLETYGLPGAWLVSPPSFTLSQITPPQGVSLSVLTPAQHPLRC